MMSSTWVCGGHEWEARSTTSLSIGLFKPRVNSILKLTFTCKILLISFFSLFYGFGGCMLCLYSTRLNSQYQPPFGVTSSFDAFTDTSLARYVFNLLFFMLNVFAVRTLGWITRIESWINTGLRLPVSTMTSKALAASRWLQLWAAYT